MLGASSGPGSKGPMILCVNCRAKLFVPDVSSVFKCPTCNSTQRAPTGGAGFMGISCNVPGCECKNFEQGDDHVCVGCSHKRSIHKISQDDVGMTMELPDYWTGDTSQSKRMQVPQQLREAVQQLMNDTWKNKATIDRIGDKRVAKKFEVISVVRNQNPRLWM